MKPKWTFKIRDYLCIGWVPQDATRENQGRWISWDTPWCEDVRQYGCPIRLHYFGKRWCWTFGARTQRYDWKRNQFADWRDKKMWRRFTVSPRNTRERYDRNHVWRWDVPRSWFVIMPDDRRHRTDTKKV